MDGITLLFASLLLRIESEEWIQGYANSNGSVLDGS